MSTSPLFLHESLPTDDEFVLDGEEGRHAARVKRLRRDEAVSVSDGRGTVAECVVTDVLDDGLQLAVRDMRRVIPSLSR